MLKISDVDDEFPTHKLRTFLKAKVILYNQRQTFVTIVRRFFVTVVHS